MGSLGTMLMREGKARKVKRKGGKYIFCSHTLPLPRQAPKMTKDMAMKVLGLTKAKTRNKVAKKIIFVVIVIFVFVIFVTFISKVAKRVEDYSENEITSAFQTQCTQLSEWQQEQKYLKPLPKFGLNMSTNIS